MTRSELIEALSQRMHLPPGQAEVIIRKVFKAMESSLARGSRIEIRGFGSFEVREYKGYTGRNPRTGAKVAVKPKKLPFFKVGKDLREMINADIDSPGD